MPFRLTDGADRMSDRGEVDPAERFLATSFSAMAREVYDAPAPEGAAGPVGYDALAGAAERLAQRRRRGYLVHELWKSALPRRALTHLCAAALLLLLAVQRGDLQSPKGRGELALIAAPRAVLESPGTRRARLNNGAELQVDVGAVAIEQADQARTQLSLSTGAVRVRVPPLPGRGQLSVRTSDAEVIVHGTSFTVRKAGPTATDVSVEEGLVEVRPRGGGRPPVFLRPGESLLVPSLSRYTAEVTRQVAELLRGGGCADPQRRLDTFLELAPATEDRSAVQYRKGFCAAQRGESEDALRWFERAAESQDRVRADNALARAAQLRAGRGAAEGTVAWLRYIERFPAGLHRDTARRFLASPANSLER